MKNSTDVKRAKQLGMNPSTAANRLKKMILFGFVEKAGLNKCHRCGEPMTVGSLSIDHVKDWLDGDVDLFWDLENITFSHRGCNSAAARQPNKRVMPEGQHWCCRCKGFRDIEDFAPSQLKSSSSGHCRSCHNTRVTGKRKEGKKGYR